MGTTGAAATSGSPSLEWGPKCDRPLDGVGSHGDADGHPLQNLDLEGSSGAEFQTPLVGAEGLVFQNPNEAVL